MKAFGKFKPYILPLVLGVVGAWIYSKWVAPRLPANLQ